MSDVVGFVLVFSLILATVGMVYTAGFSGLQNARNTERVANAEKAFEALQSNGQDVVHRGAPSRVTVIKLSDAQLGPGDPVTINVSGETPGEAPVTATVRPLVYSSGDSRLVYVDGAVIRSSSRGAAMLSEPSLLHGGSRTLVPIVETHFPQEGSVAGQTRARVRMTVPRSERSRTTTVVGAADGPVHVNLTSTQPKPWLDAWARYLDDEPGVDCGTATRTAVNCTINRSVTPVTVSRTTVRVAVE
ncbi:hypothetical protein MBEHAL_2641 [Halarchaeum acidiphilum MH1-52-1]|uniref:Uncharacterized protein n=1 Tax=Halarchaeum acidiphilum MH1-52-1 TaxID=1261545 RepID=U2YHD6_9EURY|nr:hypothetical protein [Halarchaeum acidiphilum]GAD53881.1 hypothetical protein MBEHAL_2641 [Halarchaeum acidiphilum MH1-52-1]